ncbi:MAG: alpha/beta fold hydrolase [Qingshengfaniella sp.]
MTQFFHTADGLRLAYDDTGSGTPLLCLAGLTRNMADFDPVVARFADRARILRLDSRGRGQSDRDPDHSHYSLVQEAADVLALLDHLGLEKTAILGTSRGGLIAMVLAPHHGGRLLGVCFNDIGPVVDPRGMAHIMTHLGRRPHYAAYDEAAVAQQSAMADSFPGVPLDQWRRHVRHLWRETPTGLELRYDPRLRDAVEEQAATGAAVDPWPLFDALAGVPLGLIRGANSDILSLETVTEMRRRRPDLIFGEVPDRGHVPFLSEPEAETVISDFLDRLT